MTLKQAEKMMADIRTMQRLARNEGASNRLQNCLSAAVVIVRKEIKSKRIKEIKSIKSKKV